MTDMDRTHPAWAFTHAFSKALIEALGLKGQRVRKLVLTMEVGQAVKLEVEGFAALEAGPGGKIPSKYVRVFELASFVEDTTTAEDSIRIKTSSTQHLT